MEMEIDKERTPSRFSRRIIEMLIPSLGEFMAMQKVSDACKMAKVDIQKASPGQRKIISQNLEVVCKPLGKNVALSIKQSVIEMPA